MKVKLTANVRRRLQHIRSYYKAKGKALKGIKITHAILKEAKRLEKHPHLGQEEEYLKELDQGHRYLMVDKLHKVIYRIVDPIVFITDIFDTRQDPGKMKS